MIKHSRKYIAILLCLSMMFGLAACSGGGDDPQQSGNGSTTTSGAMGRYEEQEEALPEGVLSVISMAHMPDGTLRLLGDLGGQGIGPYGVYASSQDGKFWEPVDYPWLDELFGSQIYTAALTDDGVYLSHSENLLGEMPVDEPGAEGDGAKPEKESAAGEEPADDEESQTPTPDTARVADYTFAYGDASGLTGIDFDYVPDDDILETTTLYPASNGDLIAAGQAGEVKQISTQSWKVINTYPVTVNVAMAPGVASWESTLAINSGEKITLYDLESGSSIGEISTVGSTQASYLTQKVSTVSIPSDGSAALYLNESGIYRVPMDTTVSERLVDGGLSSLGIQTLTFTNLFQVGSDEYLAVARTQDLGTRMFRYTYNPNIPTEPSQVLNVYSLRDNKTIRQAISGYQTENPDIRVNYEVGLVEGSGMTAADAMRTLSTELLAGKGPDVIVMDDMDVDGYIKKNILQDISDVVSDIDTLSNITSAFHQDGTLYAIPARFYVPMLLGDGVENVKNLDDFTSWLEAQYTNDIGIRSDELVERFYAAFSYRWFTEDGSLDEAAFRSDLEQLGKLAEGIRDLGEVYSFGDVAIDTLLWYGGATAANYSIVSGYVDVSLFDAAIQNRPTGGFHPFPNDKGDVYIPATVLGINAATPSSDNAADFVRHVLSGEVQATHLGDGFPVNAAAFEALSQNPGGDNGEMIAQLTVPDARTGELTEVSLSGAWPSDTFMSELKTMLRGAQVPVKANAVIREMMIDETAAYISGTKPLDDTVRSFKQKMDLYLSE